MTKGDENRALGTNKTKMHIFELWLHEYNLLQNSQLYRKCSSSWYYTYVYFFSSVYFRRRFVFTKLPFGSSYNQSIDLKQDHV